MKIEITSTEIVTNVGGIPARLWHGVTEEGIPCFVFVHRVCVANDQDQRQFTKELITLPPPSFMSLEDILAR